MLLAQLSNEAQPNSLRTSRYSGCASKTMPLLNVSTHNMVYADIPRMSLHFESYAIRNSTESSSLSC